MSKLILCDSRESMYNKFKNIADKLSNNNKWDLEIEAIHGDVFAAQKNNPGYKICTASNPDFTFGGGLDAAIAKNFAREISKAKEFNFSDNLFFLVTVNSNLESTKSIIQRALVGVLGYTSKNLILTGIGTGIGGLSEDELANLIEANLSSANLIEADLSSANLRWSNLSEANLHLANLRLADLHFANLHLANLRLANLRLANLTWADLSSANLSSANLRSADLSSANLHLANLIEANLRSADLSSANLRSANLRLANLIEANLIESSLSQANLSSANLIEANLSQANLTWANLSQANLSEADLSEADLSWANLSSANYSDTTRFPAYFVCPESGNFVAWKKTKNYICQLEIIGDRTSNLKNRKCRTNKAKVLGFYNLDKVLLENVKNDVSSHDTFFVYNLGEVVEVLNWSNDFRIDCAEAIHFFITFDEAKNY